MQVGRDGLQMSSACCSSLLRRALPRVSSQMDQSVGQTDQDIGEALRDIVVRVLLLPVIWAECTPNAE